MVLHPRIASFSRLMLSFRVFRSILQSQYSVRDFGGRPFGHPRMPMPEAAIDENCLFLCRKNNIWRAWKIPSVEPVSISHFEDERTNRQFRCRILGRNRSHETTPPFWAQPICHALVSTISIANLIGDSSLNSTRIIPIQKTSCSRSTTHSSTVITSTNRGFFRAPRRAAFVGL